jgi:hypothetical protein
MLIRLRARDTSFYTRTCAISTIRQPERVRDSLTGYTVDVLNLLELYGKKQAAGYL